MRIPCWLVLIGCLGGTAPLLAQEKVLRLVRTETEIRIDGVIDPVWVTADSVDDFVQQSPYHHQPPSHRTVAKVLTTGENLYCLMVCSEEPGGVEARTGKLDDTSGDIVSIMLDTFGDRQSAYKFAVTAGGTRADCRLLDDARNRDYSWDGVWWAATRVTDAGFVVEMRIPYRTLQYHEALSSWGLDFDRWKPATGEDLYWCAYEQNEGQRIPRFGHLELGDFRPAVRGLGLEVYPVGLVEAQRLASHRWDLEPDAGLDLLYNPSQRLTLQLTANPDFAQIEADPYEFNITRYESYYTERRPFFTQGSEIFLASGKERNSGFYSPLELFYSRRIGRKLPDGSEVPLHLGTRAFGRAGAWEYGGFIAGTGQTVYRSGGTSTRISEATYAAGRVKRQVLGNSSLGLLCVGRSSADGDNAVVDLDGALRGSDWQLAYQLARSYRETVGSDFAASAGLRITRPRYLVSAKGRAIGRDFDVGEVGFVPWKGLSDLVVIGGPRWYFPSGRLQSLNLGVGGTLTHERADQYTDRAFFLVASAELRPLWGGEVDFSHGRSRDAGTTYNATSLSVSSFAMAGSWRFDGQGGISRTYNFSRMYRGLYSWAGASGRWQVAQALALGSSLNAFVEHDPDGRLEEVTWNARPYLSLTPANDVFLGVYIDGLYLHTTGQVEQLLGGALFSWQYRPKSWVYLAINEVQERDAPGLAAPPRSLKVRDRAAVLKVKMLYYL
jgi:hypothetical protein